MSGVEVIAVIACVAAVVSAFKDGHAIVESIKEKRRAKRGYLPSRYLEESLARGPPAIEAEKESGVERFGAAFSVGDRIASDTLRNIALELQASLLSHLLRAQNDDSVTDFRLLIHTSDMGRVKAVRALCDLHMRLDTARPIDRRLVDDSSPSDLNKLLNIVMQNPAGNAQSYYMPAVTPQRQLMGETQDMTDVNRVSTVTTLADNNDTANRGETPVMVSSESPKQRWKLPFFSPRSIQQRRPSEAKVTDSSSPTASTTQPPSVVKTSHYIENSAWPLGSDPISPTGNGQKAQSRSSLPTSPDWVEENPWLDSTSEHNDDQITLHEKSKDNPISLSQSTPVPTPRIYVPSASNGYGGFCKGAFNFQVGSKDAIKLRKEQVIVQAIVHYWGCSSSKCAFEGPATKEGDEWIYDNSIRSCHGVRYRWSFLAKSHVTLKKVKNKTFHYRCIFCVLHGLESPVYQSTGSLMQHIAQHRDQHFGDAVLDRANCINDRVAVEEDNFDVNLPPVDHHHHHPAHNTYRGTNGLDLIAMSRQPSSVYPASGPSDSGRTVSSSES